MKSFRLGTGISTSLAFVFLRLLRWLGALLYIEYDFPKILTHFFTSTFVLDVHSLLLANVLDPLA